MPVYGSRIVSASTMAVPVIDTSHTRTPGAVPPAVTEMGIVVAGVFSSPHADPDTTRLPGQRAKNIPEIIVAVWLLTRHSKLLHAFDPVGGVLDIHLAI